MGKTEPPIVRDPAAVLVNRQADVQQLVAHSNEVLENDAQSISAALLSEARHNQGVRNNAEFAARFDLTNVSSNHSRLTDRIEVLLREQLGDGVELTVKLFDMRSPYVGMTEARDITIWARPKPVQ